MMQLPSDKYTIAWFKLAEFVVRGEKERALGMYRLLAHSLPDEAFAAQLEGDLFLAFQDERAIDSYQRSAIKYERTGRLPQAAAVHEHLIALMPDTLSMSTKIIHLYEALKNEVKIDYWMKDFVRLSIAQHVGDAAHKLIDSLHISSEYRLRFHEYLTHELITQRYQDQTVIKETLNHLLEGYVHHDNSRELAHLLAKLNAHDESLATYAQDYLKKAV